MDSHKRILLKLTGSAFIANQNAFVRTIITQIKELRKTHQFGIVVGGGNFFRGDEHGKALQLTPSIAHQIGMVATMMNGLILYDLLTQLQIPTTLFCALSCPQIGTPLAPETIRTALQEQHVLIFSGGIGTPFFTTDTTAIVRALQMGAHEVWKATNVDGIYDADPAHNNNAHLLKQVSYTDAYNKKLAIMDRTAYILAEQHKMPIRIFNLFTPHALKQTSFDSQFGSTIS